MGVGGGVLFVEDGYWWCDGLVVCPVWAGQVNRAVWFHFEFPAVVVDEVVPASADGYEVCEFCFASLGHEAHVVDFGLVPGGSGDGARVI